MTEISEEELELLDGAFAGLRALGMELQERQSGGSRLLTGLLNAALREYQHLRLGLKHSTAMAAWACRNLLDLHIYTRYALADEDGARRLAEERLKDGVELYDSFQTWLARNDPELVPAGVAARIHSLTEQLADSGLATTPPLKLKRAAAAVGLADEWANMARLTATLAQPNAFLVLGGEEEVAGWKPVLFRAGAGHGLEIFRLVKERSESQSPPSVD
jgi:hypothetical protein